MRPDPSLDKASASFAAPGVRIAEGNPDQVAGWIDLGPDPHLGRPATSGICPSSRGLQEAASTLTQASGRFSSRTSSLSGQVMTTVWERFETPTQEPRAILTSQRIAAVALEIADSQGLNGVSMRNVAAGLGCTAAALYNHMPGKGGLQRLLVEVTYGRLQLPSGADDWYEFMRDLAFGVRALMLRHPWLADLPPLAVFAPTPATMAIADRAMVVLHGLGFDHTTMAAMVRTVVAYVHGASTAEIAQRQLVHDRAAAAGTGLPHELAWLLSTGRYPMVGRSLQEADHDPQRQFEAGLDTILDGLAVRIGGCPGLSGST